MSEARSTLNLSAISSLLLLTPTQLQSYTQQGVMPKPQNGQYDTVACVQEYIRFLTKPSTDHSKTDIARHLDMSERNLSDVLRMLNIDWRETPLEEIRKAYIRDLREKAAGRGGDHAEALTLARIEETQANADFKKLQIKEKAKELINIADIEPQLLSMVEAAKQEILSIPEKLAHYMAATHNIEIDKLPIEEIAIAALNQISRAELTKTE